MLISAGRTVLLEEGLTLGVERVTFKRVFDELERSTGARVTNAAVIDRIWRNQEEFQVDVLLAVLAEVAPRSSRSPRKPSLRHSRSPTSRPLSPGGRAWPN
jgi:hypothetical protein